MEAEDEHRNSATYYCVLKMPFSNKNEDSWEIWIMEVFQKC